MATKGATGANTPANWMSSRAQFNGLRPGPGFGLKWGTKSLNSIWVASANRGTYAYILFPCRLNANFWKRKLKLSSSIHLQQRLLTSTILLLESVSRVMIVLCRVFVHRKPSMSSFALFKFRQWTAQSDCRNALALIKIATQTCMSVSTIVLVLERSRFNMAWISW